VTLRRRIGSTYVRIFRTYRAWAPTILALAALVFFPLGLLDAFAAEVDVSSLDLSSGIKVAAIVAAVGAVTMTGLLGEVFFSGAVAVTLTHPAEETRPTIVETARRLRYGRLILVDLLYVAIVAAGLVLIVAPGVAAFIWLGLAGPAVELEERTAFGALRRSVQLVRGNFWLVFWVLVPIEIVGDAIGDLVHGLLHHLLGDGFLSAWLAESLSNIVLSPLFAVAAVLLAIDLIRARDGSGPVLNSAAVAA